MNTTALENLRGKLVDLGTAAQAVGLDHHWRELAAHRQRVQDSHAAMSESAGFKASEADMGDLTITGDVQIAPPGQPAQSKGIAKAAIAATVGAALASGAMVAAHQLSDSDAAPPPVADTDTDTDTRNTIRFAD